MKFTLSWLKDHLETDASVEEIGRVLTDLGLEVEEIIDPAAKLRGFTIAKIVSAEQHPDADRLRVLRVETDEGEKQIVCGAPNARAGLIGVLAKPGDYVPGIDTTLSVGKIRGIESHGMMASERELELSDEHNGIIELPSGEVGQKFTDWLAANAPEKIDPVFDIKITPNRPDALGVRGVARDLAARGVGTLKPLREAEIEGVFASPIMSPSMKLFWTRCPSSRAVWCVASRTGRRPNGCKSGCAPSGCVRSTPWSISPISSPMT